MPKIRRSRRSADFRHEVVAGLSYAIVLVLASIAPSTRNGLGGAAPGARGASGNIDASTPPGARPSGVKASIVADGDQVADCGIDEVGSELDLLYGARPWRWAAFG